MDDKQLPEMTPTIPMPQLIERVFEKVDTGYSHYLARRIGKEALPPLLEHRINKDSDLHYGKNDRDHLIATMGQQKKILHALLRQVTNGESFHDACEAYIDHEIDTLFFVGNNLPDARNARDYLQHLLNVAVPYLQEAGYLGASEAQACYALSNAFDIQLDAYEALCTEISEISGNTTNSLVAASMMDEESPEKEMYYVDLLRRDPVTLTPEQRAAIRAQSMGMYRNILEKTYKVEFEEGEEAEPYALWMMRKALEVAAQEQRASMPEAMNKKAWSALHEKNAARMEEVLAEWTDKMESATTKAFALCELHTAIGESFAKAAHQPEDMSEILQECLDEAKTETLPRIEALRREYLMGLDLPLPRSQRLLGDKLWAGLGTIEAAENDGRETLKEAKENIGAARTMDVVVWQTNTVIEETASECFFGVADASSLLVMRDFIGILRRNLGEALLESGHYEANSPHLQDLKKLEDKCNYLSASLVCMKKGMMHHTRHAYDHPAFQAVGQYMADTGGALHAIPPSHLRSTIEPRGVHYFVELLKANGAYYHQVAHPLVPLLYAQCQKIAASKIGPVPSVTGESSEANENYLVRLETETQKLFKEKMDGACRIDPLTRKMQKVPNFDAECCHRLFPALEREARTASHRGTRH